MRSVSALALFLIVLLPAGGSTAELCDDDSDCTGTDACVGGACVPLVPDPHVYLVEAQSRWSSFVWTLQLPALFEPTPEQCCFDFTGDGVPDDQLGAVLATLASAFGHDPNAELQQAVEDGALVKVLDWRELATDLASGDVQVSLFDGEFSDVIVFDDRKAGLGHVLLSYLSFGSHGATDQLNAGSVLAGLVDVAGNGFGMGIPFMIPGETAAVRLLDPRLQAPVVYDDSPSATCSGLCTEDEDRGLGHVPQIVGGAMLGGIVPAADILDDMDAFYRQCDCAGIDPNLPVIVWGENDVTMSFDISCTDNTGDPSQCEPADPCSDLTMVCPLLPVFAQSFDIDHNDNGINESYSVGMRLGWSGTTLDGLTHLFADGFESGDTSAWSSTVQ